jgi:hypothetical protein
MSKFTSWQYTLLSSQGKVPAYPAPAARCRGSGAECRGDLPPVHAVLGALFSCEITSKKLSKLP